MRFTEEKELKRIVPLLLKDKILEVKCAFELERGKILVFFDDVANLKTSLLVIVAHTTYNIEIRCPHCVTYDDL